ncbi:MAG: hypothetical protein RLZZ621_1771 [Gemmatimonadota bacterium]
MRPFPLRTATPLLVLVIGLMGAACPGKSSPKKSGAKAAGAVAGAPNQPSRAKPMTRAVVLPDSSDQIIFGASTVLTDKGVANGLLLSDTMLTYDDNTRLELRRVHVTFYTKQGVQDGVMTAREGTYNTRLSRLEARGDVVIVRGDGKRLTSQQLVYDQARNQFFTDSAFVLNEPKRTFTGNGFESDPRLANFKCLRNCKGIAPVKIPTR